MSFDFAPKGWTMCNGQLLPINQNQALFSLLGTMYGGNGQTNFALPDFRGRAPVHVGNGFTQGQQGGQEFHTVTQSEMPAHNHFAQATSTSGTVNQPQHNLLATMYGGDGQETFALPNLSGRVPLHFGQGPGISQSYQQGEAAGVEAVTLTVQQIPTHNHPFTASSNIAQNPQPTDSVPAQSTTVK